MAKYKLSLKLSNNQTVEADGTIDIPSRIISESETVLFGPASVSFAADTENSTGMYVSAENAISIEMTAGEKYRVVWDGVSYIVYDEEFSETSSSGNGWYEWDILGNGDNALNGYAPGTASYPFAITRDRWKNSGEILVYATDGSTATSHTIAVYKISGEYDKIGPEYLYGYKKCLYPGKAKWSASNGPNIFTNTAECSFIVGENSTISGIASFSVGVLNTVKGNASSALGFQNTINTGVDYSLISGRGNSILNGYSNHVFGRQNEISGSETVGSSTKKSQLNGIFGMTNKMIGAAQECFIAGADNTFNGYNTYSAIVGKSNAITRTSGSSSAATYNCVIGCGNTITDKNGVFIAGHYNDADIDFQTVLGMFSAADDTAALKLGWGSKSTKKNIFVVHKDGRVTAGADPTEDMDLATKKFVVPKPSDNPTEDSVVVVGSTGATSYKAVSELGGSGGEAATWYSHTISVTNSGSYAIVVNFTLPFADQINTRDKFVSLINSLTENGSKQIVAKGSYTQNIAGNPTMWYVLDNIVRVDIMEALAIATLTLQFIDIAISNNNIVQDKASVAMPIINASFVDSVVAIPTSI